MAEKQIGAATTITSELQVDHHDQYPAAPASSNIIQKKEAGDQYCGNNNNTSLQRLKRDEWSEGAVWSLLDAYEAKWALRNRAKLKGQDWEEVARHVSARANSNKASKTSTQCKNKIESMKKRYRSEVAAPDPTSTWPLFPRLHSMLRGGTTTGAAAPPSAGGEIPPQPLMLLHPPPPPSPRLLLRQDMHETHHVNGSGAPVVLAEEEADHETHNLVKLDKEEAEKKDVPPETESSTPEYDIGHRETSNYMRVKTKKKKKKKKQQQKQKKNTSKKKQAAHVEELEVAESVRWLAEVMLRSEQARMETMKELERIRAETETQKAKMDLKRTEIMANTQLQIARILAGKEEAIDSSLRIGRS